MTPPLTSLTDAVLDAVVAAALDAGRAIQAVRAGGIDLAIKGDDSPVTRADHESDALLRARLPRIVPAAWLSEETADDANRLKERRLWVVDPLDGTKEFVEGVPQYAVSIGLVEDGVPVLGVVHNPSSGEVFSARRGGGLRRDGRPAGVRAGRGLGASRSEMKRGEFDPFEGGAWELRPIGSIAYKLALVAAGDLAATVSRGPKHEWDVAGGALLVAEAGGRVADAFGEALRFNRPFPKVKGILAGEPAAFDRVLAVCRASGMSDRMKEFD
jgi:myo-inositol-1(or 4)-monophosphatase